MDAPQFLAEFGHIANALGGVAQLRKLVLQLAIQGKLVEQDSSDTPARTLLKEIEAEKKRLVNAGRIKQPKSLPPIKPKEISYQLPQGWEWVRLPECYFGIGNKSNQIQTKDYLENGQFPVIDQGNNFIVGYCDDQSKLLQIDNPVIVFGDHTKNIKFIDFNFVIGADGVKVLNPYIGISAKFLYRLIQSFDLTDRGYARHFKVLNEKLIPLAPLEEQSRIVAKVDELMALCDTLEAQQQVRRKLQNNLRQSTLQAVASATSPHELQTTWARLADNFGRLFHASEDLIDLDQCIKQLALKGLLSVRAEGEMVNSEIAELTRTSTACVLDTEMDWSIPDHWVWARCAWLGEARLGKMLDVAKNKGDFRPYLRNINVRWGRFNLSDVLQMRIQEHELSKVSVRKGDLVICEGGEPGRAAVWSGEEEFVIQKALHRFRCNEHVLPEYILFCLEHDYFSGRLSRYFTGATIKHLTGRALAEYTIPLPPVDEQKRILLAANELMHSVATLKERLIAGNRCAAALAAASVASLTGIAIEQERVTNPSEAEAAT